MVRVVVFTDEPLVSNGIRQLLEPQPDIELVGVADEISKLIEQCATLQPDLALLSNAAVCDRTVLTALRWECPNTAVVLWVNEISPEHAHQAMETGARGVLRRKLPTEMVLKCIRKVSEGELWFEKSLATTFMSGRSVRLSRRESQMIALLSEGQKNKEIAASLSISEGTVKVYMSRLIAKVGAKDRYELALFGLRNGRDANMKEQGNAAGLRSLFITPPDASFRKGAALRTAAPASRIVS
jgi:DNA-binding NarL/FixJ family response regulator